MSGHELNHSSGTAHARREPADLLGAPGTDAQIRPVPARPHPLDRKPRGPERRVATIADLGQREVNALVGSLESLLRDPIPERARSRVSTACALITSRAPSGCDCLARSPHARAYGLRATSPSVLAIGQISHEGLLVAAPGCRR